MGAFEFGFEFKPVKPTGKTGCTGAFEFI